MFQHPQHLQLTSLAGAAKARHMVHGFVAGCTSPELCDDAELLTSEVVTNALLHACAPILLTVSAVGAGVRVEVTDGSPRSPLARDHGELSTSGRGVELLDLLARWGVDRTVTGKTVWFELGETRRSNRDQDGSSALPEGP